MKIHYKNKRIEKVFKTPINLQKKYGAIDAQKIDRVMKILDSADCMTDLPPASRPHPREPKSRQIFSIDISKHRRPRRLLFKPYGDYDLLDFSTIKEVEILEVEYSHS